MVGHPDFAEKSCPGNLFSTGVFQQELVQPEVVNGSRKIPRRDSVWENQSPGIKKLATEMTSIKFLLLIFICIWIWQKFTQDSIGLGTALLSIGIQEIPDYRIRIKETGNEFRYRIEITGTALTSKGLPTQIQDAMDTEWESLVKE